MTTSSTSLGDTNAEAFYWQPARDSTLTAVAVQLFQIAASHDGQDFETAKVEIDKEYAVVRGQESERHGGKFQTAVQAYQENGWISVGDGTLRITEAGKQALLLLAKTPDYLKAVPQSIVELLARFQLNNPARPPSRNDVIADLRATSDIFPYWTIWKIMRSCDNKVTVDELKRFVFRLHRSEAIDETIARIHAFRSDKSAGMGGDDLDAKYGKTLEGANSEPKYWMGRAGVQIGTRPPLIWKPDPSTYVLSDGYLELIDEVLANEPVFKEELSPETWMANFGRPVPLGNASIATIGDADLATPDFDLQIGDDDIIAQEVQALLLAGSRSFLLTGPPGTSKSWYARQLAGRIVDGDMTRVRQVQFHPSFGYEDFIEGFVPEVALSGGLPTFVRKWKIFAEACALAQNGEFAVLVIDEFSRGDAGRIFGEALTYMEPDYRDSTFKLASGRDFSVPSNLVIIGTMNPYDRSVSAVDVAMQRRFEILRMNPDVAILRDLLVANDMADELVTRVEAFFLVCQEVMLHGGLGHAYFLGARDVESLARVWTYRLEPLFEQELQFAPADLAKIRGAYATLITV